MIAERIKIPNETAGSVRRYRRDIQYRNVIMIDYVYFLSRSRPDHAWYCPMYPVSWSFTNMDGTCSNKSRAWREKKL